MKIFHYFKIIFLYFTFVRAKMASFLVKLQIVHDFCQILCVTRDEERVPSLILRLGPHSSSLAGLRPEPQVGYGGRFSPPVPPRRRGDQPLLLGRFAPHRSFGARGP